MQVLDGIANALEPAGLGLLLVPGRADDPTTVQRAMVDGFIIYSMVEDDLLLTAALRRRLPTVLIDQPSRAGVATITVNDVDGAQQAATHLLDLGHRHFAIITDRLCEARTGANTARAWSPYELTEETFFFTRRRFQGYRSPGARGARRGAAGRARRTRRCLDRRL